MLNAKTVLLNNILYQRILRIKHITFQIIIMNKKFSNILMVSIVITIFGFLMDSDVKEPSVIMRFVEFFAMIAIVFIITFLINGLVNLTKIKLGF